MTHISLTPNSMAPSPLPFSLVQSSLSSTSASDISFWEAMRAEEAVYSDTEDYEMEYACKLVREQALTEETMVVKLMIRKPVNEESNGTTATLLEITGTKSVTKDLVVKSESFTVPKDQIVEMMPKSTKMESSPSHAKDLGLTPPNSMSLKEALDSVRQSPAVPTRPHITTSRPPLRPKVAQQRNIPTHPSHRPRTPVREQSSPHATSPKTDLVETSFPKRSWSSKPPWRHSQTDDKFKRTGILKKRSIVHPQFMIGRSVPSWNFLLRRPMYREIMTVKPISQLNLQPKCSDFMSAMAKESPLDRYLAARSAKRRFVRSAITKNTVTRTANPSIRVTGLKYHNLRNIQSWTLSADTRRLMTGQPLTGRIVESLPPPTQSLSNFRMPAALKVNEQIYPFKLIPSPAEQRPLETSTTPSLSLM